MKTTRINLPAALTTSAAALLLASAAAAQVVSDPTQAANPRDMPGQTVTQPTATGTYAAPMATAPGAPKSLNADEVRARTEARMDPAAEAPEPRQADPRETKPQWTLDADETRAHTRAEMREDAKSDAKSGVLGDQSSLMVPRGPDVTTYGVSSTYRGARPVAAAAEEEIAPLTGLEVFDAANPEASWVDEIRRGIVGDEGGEAA
ncbi:MAG: hypothetical protein VYD87_18050 [Pseudomonadota bacterium]|nr:hypothetical protein [Pseudomonadota bacterium]